MDMTKHALEQWIKTIKGSVDGLLNWLKGGTTIPLSAPLQVSGNGNGYRASNDDETVSVDLSVGSGGTNHGIWSSARNRWMIYSDGTYTWFDDNGTGHYRWDMGTLNTTDTWVPVLRDGKLQHRVIPARLGDIIQVKKVSLGSQTVNAQSTKSINLYTACVNAAPSGYSFAGVVGYSTNHGGCVIISARPENHTYSFEYRNVTNSAATSTPEVFALYTRN